MAQTLATTTNHYIIKNEYFSRCLILSNEPNMSLRSEEILFGQCGDPPHDTKRLIVYDCQVLNYEKI